MSDTPVQAPPTGTPAGKKEGGSWVWDPATKKYVYLEPNIDFESLVAGLPQHWKDTASELYGGIYALIEGNSELEDLLLEAVRTGLPKDAFLAKLRKTEWWKATSNTARQWDIAKELDPKTAQQQVEAQVATVRAAALAMGITLSDAALAQVAETSLRLNFNEAQISNAIGAEATKNGGSQIAQGYYGNQIRTLASNYGIPISDSTLEEWSMNIATGKQSVQTFDAWARDLAKNMYPAFSSGFDRGLSFKSMTEPYAQFASQILEMPTSQMNFTDPKWAAAFNQKDDKGNPTTMSYGAWLDYLRSDPSFGWEYTDNARNTAYDVALQLGQLFGRA